ncbi:hypothetical protein C6352_19740 [Bacillus thuringiensis]|uniref:Uncharacterized protein n=1 Tax=Bacillus mycoides TaxID=1405 RepID=A0A4U3A8W4_BACMY|nr:MULTISPECIES: hypothetical protein [Bacillus cereus group]PRT09155.1 hypothetical protein C6352_19740 [Bacillus thuringiensis]TKI84195.1 hypothetical protein FC701_14845 [Bacillus mycoides]
MDKNMENMKNSIVQFDSVIEKYHGYKELLKKDLKEIILKNCKTYGEIDRFLLVQTKSAHWNNNQFKTLIIEELKEEFEREKNSLSVQ